jgi:hypothetical protein
MGENMTQSGNDERERRWRDAANAAMDAAKPVGHALMAVADAEQAELRAEVERLRSAERFHWRPRALTGDRHAIEAEIEHARAEAAERALADERAKVARVEALHVEVDRTSGGQRLRQPVCAECAAVMPCPTLAALAGPEPDTTAD